MENYKTLIETLIEDLQKCKSFEDINNVCSNGVDISYGEIENDNFN